ncbi:hypothetical protein D7X74_04910 [Corallococcus sp. CA047B]|uniref:hypothetical protein n=1 Tax=Corallococcus sp. CA047B TaxID=2316729 RepID=UPI000EA15A6B|nr:hypothetical protein [Corallococcus sp. CA047B]RKH20141.1 hypothetical protein D7X74_04910 [Corallococcus sp. CA047B]
MAPRLLADVGRHLPLVLFHEPNHFTREIVSCGKNRSDAFEAMIVYWMMATADEHDIIRLLDRTVLLKLPTASF